jgi:hypothetical protein
MGETIGIIILDGVIGLIILAGVALGIVERMTGPLWNRWQNRRWADVGKAMRGIRLQVIRADAEDPPPAQG